MALNAKTKCVKVRAAPNTIKAKQIELLFPKCVEEAVWSDMK